MQEPVRAPYILKGLLNLLLGVVHILKVHCCAHGEIRSGIQERNSNDWTGSSNHRTRCQSKNHAMRIGQSRALEYACSREPENPNTQHARVRSIGACIGEGGAPSDTCESGILRSGHRNPSKLRPTQASSRASRLRRRRWNTLYILSSTGLRPAFRDPIAWLL